MVVVVDSTPPVIPPPARGSLIVGPYDLLDTSGPVIVVNSSDYGSGLADVATVSRLLLDGDIVTGSRTANRQIVLDVAIDSSLSPGGVGTVMANLLAAVNRPLWQITWTPDGSSPPVVFDCQRGQVTRGYNGGLRASATLTIPASPFTRDPAATVLAPPTSGAGSGVLDALATTTGLTGAPAYTYDYPNDATTGGAQTGTISGYSGNPAAATLAVDSVFFPPGQSASVKQTTNAVGETYSYQYVSYEQYYPGGGSQIVYSTGYSYDSQFYYRWHRTVTSVDLTDTSQLAVYAATDLVDLNPPTATAHNAGKWGGGSDRTAATDGDWRLTLYSASGSSTWVTNRAIGSTSNTADLSWSRIVFSVTGTAEATTGTFDRTAVTSYRLEHWTWTQTQNDTGKSVWLSQLDAIAANGGVNLTGPFGLVRFDGVQGAARTPVSLAVSATGGTLLSNLLIARTPNPPAGFSPVLSDPTAHGGSSASPTGPMVGSTVYNSETWVRPALSFGGTYAVLARVYNQYNNAGTATFTATLTGDTASTQTASLAYAVSDPDRPAVSTFGWITLGTVTLPPRRVDPANAAATITFVYLDNNMYVDLVVLVDLSGDIINIALPSGHTCSQFFIDAPGPTDQRGKVSGGTLADRSDAVDLTQWSTGLLTNFDPGSNTITMVADNATTGATAQLSYYARWPGEKSQ